MRRSQAGTVRSRGGVLTAPAAMRSSRSGAPSSPNGRSPHSASCSDTQKLN